MQDDDVSATRNGLLQCLRMLTEEASILRLDRTHDVLLGAIDVCRQEVLGTPTTGVPLGMALH